MTGQGAVPAWPPGSPPDAAPFLHWVLSGVAELPGVRADVRRALADGRFGEDALDQLVLALDEMASNALRHGGGRVEAAVRTTDEGFLVEVTDAAAARPPTPAIDRDPSEGGLGLYLIAELATGHGWYASGAAKHVWALFPRR